MNSTKNKYLAGPYLIWMTGFIIIPLLMIFYYGLTSRDGAFTFENIASIGTPEHLKALVLSLVLAGISTAVCLLIAYPLALILRNRHIGRGSFVVFIFILPMWMNFLLRTLAWQTLLEKTGSSTRSCRLCTCRRSPSSTRRQPLCWAWSTTSCPSWFCPSTT